MLVSHDTADEHAVSPATAHAEAQNEPHFEHEHIQEVVHDENSNDAQPIVQRNPVDDLTRREVCARAA